MFNPRDEHERRILAENCPYEEKLEKILAHRSKLAEETLKNFQQQIQEYIITSKHIN